jgi:Spy/CpxP family protein refolding chaperone
VFEQVPRPRRLCWRMTKLIALVTAGLFAASVTFAGEHGNCTKQAGNKENMAACEVSMANLNLTGDQKAKMDTLMAEHQKEGCTPQSEAKYMKEAKKILNKEQYAKFKAECKKGEKTEA